MLHECDADGSVYRCVSLTILQMGYWQVYRVYDLETLKPISALQQLTCVHVSSCQGNTMLAFDYVPALAQIIYCSDGKAYVCTANELDKLQVVAYPMCVHTSIRTFACSAYSHLTQLLYAFNVAK